MVRGLDMSVGDGGLGDGQLPADDLTESACRIVEEDGRSVVGYRMDTLWIHPGASCVNSGLNPKFATAPLISASSQQRSFCP